MIDAIVTVTIVFTVVFVAAWLARPDLRAWIERPKYRFQANVRSYDEWHRAGAAAAGARDLQPPGRDRVRRAAQESDPSAGKPL